MAQNYRALTRTYRPQTFDDIVSQEHVTSTLNNAIKQNRLSHAYMFCGPRGVGKTTMARVLARTINQIDSEVDGESLNQTLNVVEMDAASNNGVEDVRELRERVRIPPQNGRYKVYIIDEVHMLSKQAFNALLKTLEEPPDHAIFIFATTEPHKVLPTILSRVQRFDFKRISIDEIVQRLRKISLEEHISIDEESLHIIAKKADGALRDALGLMDQAIAFCGDNITEDELLRALNIVGTDRLFDFMETVAAHDADAGLKLVHNLLQDGYDIQEFLVGLTEHLRNLYIARQSENMHLVEASEETKKRYKKEADTFSREDLMRMLHIVSEAQVTIKNAQQPRVQFEILLLKLVHMKRSEELDGLITELKELKKNLSNRDNASGSPNGNGSTGKSTQQPVQQQSPNGSQQKKESSKEPTDSAGEEQKHESSELVEDEDDFDYLGQSALSEDPEPVQTRTASKTISPASKTNGTTETETPREDTKKLTLKDVETCWPEFVDSLKEDFPMMVHLQMQRILPKKLTGIDLTLCCENPFAQKMVEEQKQDLAKQLKEFTGVMLRFKVTVQQAEKKSGETMSPYERFKQLQQKDPIIRDLVDMFGAELEY